MKARQFWGIVILAGLIVGGGSSGANAVSLTAIYDFRDQLDPLQTSFEGLDFTNDGTLWITSAPNTVTQRQLLGVDLNQQKVVSNTSFTASALFNPVGLASDGTNLYIANNEKGIGYFNFDNRDRVYAGTLDTITGQVGLSSLPTVTLGYGVCLEPEGSAYLNGYLYFSCEKGKNVIKVDMQGNVIERYAFDNNVLGLGATEDKLIVGDYKGTTERRLLLYDVISKSVTQTIDLSQLFVGADSDYAKLTGELYKLTIADNGDIRSIPDPDGIAYRDGKIYMTFEHDLRVYEITLNEPPTVPEPGTLLLLGLGLFGLASYRQRRA